MITGRSRSLFSHFARLAPILLGAMYWALIHIERAEALHQYASDAFADASLPCNQQVIQRDLQRINEIAHIPRVLAFFIQEYVEIERVLRIVVVVVNGGIGCGICNLRTTQFRYKIREMLLKCVRVFHHEFVLCDNNVA